MRLTTYLFAALLLLAFSAKAQESAPIKWMTIEEALSASEKNPKKIIIDIYTDWCGWCKVMDRDTFANAAVASYINENYYAVKLNAEKQASFTYKGKAYNLETTNGRSINTFVLAISNGNIGYPTTAYLDESQNVLTLLSGFQKPDQLLPILQYLKADLYKSMTFEDFIKQQQAKQPSM
jgi:thioredoxin-related protein